MFKKGAFIVCVSILSSKPSKHTSNQRAIPMVDECQIKLSTSQISPLFNFKTSCARSFWRISRTCFLYHENALDLWFTFLLLIWSESIRIVTFFVIYAYQYTCIWNMSVLDALIKYTLYNFFVFILDPITKACRFIAGIFANEKLSLGLKSHKPAQWS